jgi:hypothetical protein
MTKYNNLTDKITETIVSLNKQNIFVLELIIGLSELEQLLDEQMIKREPFVIYKFSGLTIKIVDKINYLKYIIELPTTKKVDRYV